MFFFCQIESCEITLLGTYVVDDEKRWEDLLLNQDFLDRSIKFSNLVKHNFFVQKSIFLTNQNPKFL